MDETVKFTVEFSTGNAVSGAKEFQRALEGVLDTSKKIGQASPLGGMETALGAIPGWATGAAAALGGVFAGVMSIGKAIEFVKAGIANADYLRDLQLSLNAMTGSVEAGTKAFQFFEEVGKKTRVTGDELAKMFGETLPLATQRGFSVEGAQRWVAQMAKLAPAIGKTVEETMDMSNQILAGRVRATNVLAAAIGLDAKAYTAGRQGLESVFQKVNELAGAGEEMGQTFASAAHHIKDDLLDAFSAGFNEARGGVDTGITALTEAFRDPDLLGAIRGIGEAVAELLPVFLDTFKKALGIAEGFFVGLAQMRAAARRDEGNPFAAMFFSDEDQRNMERSQQKVDDLRKQREYQQTFGRTAQPFVGGAGPIPSLETYVLGVGEMDEASKKLNTTLDGTAGSIKKVRDEGDKYAGSLDKAASSVRDAEMAYAKLLTPPETDPLLKQLQALDEQTAGFVNRMNDLAAGFRATAGKAGIPPEVAKGLNDAAEAVEALGKKSVKGPCVDGRLAERPLLREGDGGERGSGAQGRHRDGRVHRHSDTEVQPRRHARPRAGHRRAARSGRPRDAGKDHGRQVARHGRRVHREDRRRCAEARADDRHERRSGPRCCDRTVEEAVRKNPRDSSRRGTRCGGRGCGRRVHQDDSAPPFP